MPILTTLSDVQIAVKRQSVKRQSKATTDYQRYFYSAISQSAFLEEGSLQSRPSPVSPERLEPRSVEDRKLWAYLNDASQSGDVSDEMAERVWAAWLGLRRQMGSSLPVPDAATGPGGELLLIWNQGPHHLELEFLPDGSTEFFSRHQETDILWGEDYRADAPLSEDAREQIKVFSRR